MRRFVLAALAVAGTIALSYGQPGVGAKYDTRDPVVCKSTKEPATGGPSPSQAKDYVRCAAEKIGGGNIFLMENVEIETGKSRPFSGYTDVGHEDIDNSQPVYPIRGTADFYQCSPPGSSGGDVPAKGHNCTLTKATPIAGTCYKTTFGDWHCPTHGTGPAFVGVHPNMPPPK
jgi:hypothetical protein